jgi:transposase
MDLVPDPAQADYTQVQNDLPPLDRPRHPRAFEALGEHNFATSLGNAGSKGQLLAVELVEILRKMAPEPTYKIDVIARQHGHEVVRTPPYHPELQPIETCWGILKNEVARHCDFTLENLKRQLDHAFDKITAVTCQRIIKKVRSVEERFWEEDARLDQAQENLIL